MGATSNLVEKEAIPFAMIRASSFLQKSQGLLNLTVLIKEGLSFNWVIAVVCYSWLQQISSAVSWPGRVTSLAPQFNPPQGELFKQLQVSHIIKIHMNMCTSRQFNVPASSCPAAGHAPQCHCSQVATRPSRRGDSAEDTAQQHRFSLAL